LVVVEVEPVIMEIMEEILLLVLTGYLRGEVED
jgi:hypothetical protein